MTEGTPACRKPHIEVGATAWHNLGNPDAVKVLQDRPVSQPISLASMKSNGSGLRALHVPRLDGRGNRHLHSDTVDVVPARMRKATG
jgi:hypothetical protein